MSETVPGAWLIGLDHESLRPLEEGIRSFVGEDPERHALPGGISSRILGFLKTSLGLGESTRSSLDEADREHLSHLILNKVRMISLPLEGPHGFISDGLQRPVVSVCLAMETKEGRTIVIAVTRSFLDRVMKKSCWLNILAQTVMRGLFVHEEGLFPLAAIVEESVYNSFATAGSPLSDLVRDTLESCADRSEYGLLERMASCGSTLKERIRELPYDRLSPSAVQKALKLAGCIEREALVLTGLHRLTDYATGKPLHLRPADFISVRHRTEVSIADLPCLYLPPYLAGPLAERLEDMDYQGLSPQVRVIRDVIAYRDVSDPSDGSGFTDSVRDWVISYIEFCDRNIEGLKLLQRGIMNQADIVEVRKIIESMLDVHDRLCTESRWEYLDRLDSIIRDSAGSETVSLALNRLINTIHQDVLENVFGVFKGWKSAIGEVNSVSSKAVCVTCDDSGAMEYYPANKVNIIDCTGDFKEGIGTPARTVIESYLSTNVHLRDNCYLDCISHSNKAWFFVDSGIHGATVFLDLDPTKPMITASYAEGNVEDGNMARMRLLADTLAELGFSVQKSDVTLVARLGERTSCRLSVSEFMDKVVWSIQAFASVADFDEEIEYGRISNRSLSFHQKRLSSSGTGFPLYLITKGAIELSELSGVLARINSAVCPMLNEELEHLDMEKIPDMYFNPKGIDLYFNRAIEKGINSGELLYTSTMSLYRNPGHARPHPLACLTGLLPDDILVETARILNILDKVAGAAALENSSDMTATVTRLSLLSGPLCIYGLRDRGTYKPMKAFAVDGECLRKVFQWDNIIRVPADLRDILERSGYHLDVIETMLQWANPVGTSVKGIRIGAIPSCPGIATGFLKKNRPSVDPDEFRSSIFSDNVLPMKELGGLKQAEGFITTGDSTLSHAQLTARTFGKPGVILHSARWVGETTRMQLLVPLGSRMHPVDEGAVVTVDGSRGLVVFPGMSLDAGADFSGSVREAFSLMTAIDGIPQPEEAITRLRGLVACTDNLEILKFIVQEFFLTPHSMEILRCVMESGKAELVASLKGSMKDIMLDARRRLWNDMDVASRRMAGAVDLVEAFFVCSRIESQLRRAAGVETLISPRVDLPTFDYKRELRQIRAMFESRREEFRAAAVERLEPFMKDLESLDDMALEFILRTIDGVTLPLNDGASRDDRLELWVLRIRHVMDDRLSRLHGLDDFRVMELERAGRLTAHLTGNKAASLGELMRGLPDLCIPPGFVLGSEGIGEIIDKNGEQVRMIRDILDVKATDKAECLRHIIPLATSFSFPDDMKQRIIFLYHGLEREVPPRVKIAEIERLAALCGIDSALLEQPLRTIQDMSGLSIGAVIARMSLPGQSKLLLRRTYEVEGGLFTVVRSSSIHEDTRTEMMAGRYMSYTYIRGAHLLLDSILKCIAYYWIELGAVADTQPVLIHRQIESDVALVVNSINLSEHRWDEVIINASWGAGEGLVSSEVASDLYILDAASCTIKHSTPGLKTTRSVFDAEAGHGTTTIAIENRAEWKKQILTDEDATRVARLARRIHTYLDYPVDIEAIMHNGTIHVVQARPLVFPFPFS